MSFVVFRMISVYQPASLLLGFDLLSFSHIILLPNQIVSRIDQRIHYHDLNFLYFSDSF